MIGRLTGVVVDDDAEGDVVLDVHGVGYELTVPLGTLGRAPVSEDGRAITLFVHTHLRQDALVLFGFSSQVERRVFRVLLGVPNVGPRLAMSVLSGLPSAELAKAVQGRDVRTLMSVPGVGKKLADRILLELQGKLTFALGAVSDPSPGVSSRAAGAVGQQVVEALVRLGYRQAQAEWAVASLGESVEQRPVAEVIREALVSLRR